MEKVEWLKKFHDREKKYLGNETSHLYSDMDRTIAFTCDDSRLTRLDTQIALITSTNLFSRMWHNIVLAFEDAPLHEKLQWLGSSLHTCILDQMNIAFPYGNFHSRKSIASDFCIHFGCNGVGLIIDGMGSNSYMGFESSNLQSLPDENIFGTSFAVILAASHFFRHPFMIPKENFRCNTLYWEEGYTQDNVEFIDRDIGSIYFIGLGSVGSAAIYYLSLHTHQFSPALIDKKRVEIHNLSRSPIFNSLDCQNENINSNNNIYKVESVNKFLNKRGISPIIVEAKELLESDYWFKREIGTPDIVVSEANENNVRKIIETQLPPLQIYSTTGKNWNFTLFRHKPSDDSCSLCVFPPDEIEPKFTCATNVSGSKTNNISIDAALPFLSFGAGLMTAAELAKLRLPNFPTTESRVSCSLKLTPCFLHFPIKNRIKNCVCEENNFNNFITEFKKNRYFCFC